MKQYLVLALIACLTGNAWAQKTETRSIGSFSGISVSEGIDVFLQKGNKESLRVEVGDDMSLEDVITEISGTYLKIHLSRSNIRKVNVKVYVTYVNLEKLIASSAGGIYSHETIQAGDIEINASSAASIELKINARNIKASASSAADLEFSGKAQSLRVHASSGGEVDAYDLDAENVEVEASSGGAAKVSVSQSLRANASSGGSIRYRGNPDKSITNSSSGGSVKKSS